ncbi:hypothetical protein PSPO01_16471 [Paraphaeosphaeria sporulosa]
MATKHANDICSKDNLHRTTKHYPTPTAYKAAISQSQALPWLSVHSLRLYSNGDKDSPKGDGNALQCTPPCCAATEGSRQNLRIYQKKIGGLPKYFEVNVPSEVQTLVKTRPRGHADLYRALIDEQLTAGSHEQEVRAEIYSSQVTKTEVSPWLEMTSVFDQAKFNSFIAGRSGKHDRMIMVKLGKSTFRAYNGLWKRLLCFVYRTSQPTQSIPLPHRLTNAQLCHLDRALRLAEETLSFQRQPGSDASSTDGDRAGEVVRDLDRASLQLCIALLDHTLKGDHFESVVCSFLAVLGIDENPGGVFRGPLSYSPDLSKFIKMAQMLVVQQSVVATEEGEVDHPSDMLDEMRERFMVRGSRTAFDWACHLRSYGKKVVSNTMSLGSITWTEDGSSVQYKDTGFSMDALRRFVASQVRKAQQELEGLLLLHPDEARDDVVPQVLLHRLQDNHGNERKGWNFLQDQRNSGQLQQGGDRWLLDRLRWKKKAVQAYFEKVDEFLKRLLLLIHITGGQPPRGTELIGLQHSNTAQGQHRGVFIEDGLIGTVTSYHKGYNITGSTKIVHRYLPKEVSELLVYYLWLVLPFWQQLDILVYKRRDPHSTFLWPKGNGTWNANRLTQMISQEARLYLDTKLGILAYRHLAIAISRKHLLCGGFKLDYGVDKKLADEQATHGTWIAGTVYARGLQEAPGHVKARSSEYRAIIGILKCAVYASHMIQAGDNRKKDLSVSQRQDSTFVYYYAMKAEGENESAISLIGKQNLSPHSNAWVAFSPADLQVNPVDPSIVAVATSSTPHMKLLIVKLRLPPEVEALSDGSENALSEPVTQASQARSKRGGSHSSQLWRPDGSGIYISSDDVIVRGFEAATGRLTASLSAHEPGSKIRCLCAGEAIFGNGDKQGEEFLLTGGFDQKLVLWKTG